VLSGFLITGILCDTKNEKHFFSIFYARRMLRIFPIYYLFLSSTFLLSFWFPRILENHPISIFNWYFTYTSNILVGLHNNWDAAPYPLHHFWTLAIEEQFYLLWPVLVFVLPRRTTIAICGALVMVSLAVRIGLHLAGNPLTGYLLTPARIDSLAVGGL